MSTHNPTTIQIQNAHRLIDLLQRAELSATPPVRWHHAKLQAPGYMDLSIDVLHQEDRKIRFSLAHNGLLNGDVMADPDMELTLDQSQAQPFVVAHHYQNDYMGVFRSIVTGGGQAELDDFLHMWLINLIDQGHR